MENSTEIRYDFRETLVVMFCFPPFVDKCQAILI